VTNTDPSPLAQAARDRVLLRAGSEATVSCKTYVASLAALAWMEAVVGDSTCADDVTAELTAAAGVMGTYLGEFEAHVAAWQPRLEGVRNIFVAGRGGSLAAVGTGALICKEAAGFPVEGMSCPALRHGPFEMCGPETLALVFEGAGPMAEANRRLVDDICRAGGSAELIGASAPLGPGRLPMVSERCVPLVEILPLQMLSVALAAQAGREPGRFIRAAKVTTVE